MWSLQRFASPGSAPSSSQLTLWFIMNGMIHLKPWRNSRGHPGAISFCNALALSRVICEPAPAPKGSNL